MFIRLTICLLFVCMNLYSQNQQIADSLKIELQNKEFSDSLQLKILYDIAFNTVNPDEITKYSDKLYAKAIEQNNNFYIYDALANLGDAYRLKGDYEAAFYYNFKNLEHAENQKKPQLIGTSNCSIGNTYAVIGDHKNAEIFYSKCLELLKDHGGRLQFGIALFNLGDNLLKQHKSDSAIQYLQKASFIFDEHDYKSGQAYSIGNMGLVYARQEKFELAEETLKQAIDILEELGDHYAISDYLNHIVDIYIEKQEHWLALEYANIAYEKANKMGYKEQLKDASLRLSRIYEAMNKSGQAFDYLKTYITYRDSLKNESIIYRMSELRREYELAQLKKKAAERTVENNNTDSKSEIPNYYALFLGVNDYKNNDEKLTDLHKPLKDAELLYHTLTSRYVFDPEKVILVSDPTRADIINALEALSATITEEDDLLIFYAGHGLWDEKLQIGYWLPSDAISGSKSNWISNSTIRDYISGLTTKHTLLISDACFSGGIFKTRALSNGIDAYGFSKLYKLPSRKAMTSGTLSTVPDESQFMKYLIKRLEENNEEYLTARQLFSKIETAILNNTSNVPQYGIIQNSGDEGGEFIFIRKKELNQN